MATYQGEGMRPTLAQREQKEAEVSFRQHSWGPRSPSPSPKPWCVQLPRSGHPSCQFLSQLREPIGSLMFKLLGIGFLSWS